MGFNSVLWVDFSCLFQKGVVPLIHASRGTSVYPSTLRSVDSSLLFAPPVVNDFVVSLTRFHGYSQHIYVRRAQVTVPHSYFMQAAMEAMKPWHHHQLTFMVFDADAHRPTKVECFNVFDLGRWGLSLGCQCSEVTKSFREELLSRRSEKGRMGWTKVTAAKFESLWLSFRAVLKYTGFLAKNTCFTG